MATRKATKRQALRRHPFYARLVDMGCEFCPTCFAYMFPGHQHVIGSLAVDRHTSRYAVVGGYGHVKLVDLDADAIAA